MKKLGITFSPSKPEILEQKLSKIKSIAKDYEVIFAKHDDTILLECEIIFGHAKAQQLKNSSALKWIHTQSAGVDSYLNPEHPLPKHVVITNSTGAYGISIAEHMLAMCLTLMRKTNIALKNQQNNLWDRSSFNNLNTIFGSEICIVGLGDIGSRFAGICNALGANITAVVRNKRENMPLNIDKLFYTDSLALALKGADVVALCLPSTNQTQNLFNKDMLLKLKKGSILLNIGRGDSVDTTALIDLLKCGHIGAAGLDVVNPEPLPQDSPLWDIPNVILTPHISASDQGLTQSLIIDKFLSYLHNYINNLPFERTIDRNTGY